MPLARKVSIVKYEQKPEKGARLRMRDWKDGQPCLCGSEGEAWYDVTLYKNLLYLCIKSHTSSEANNPQTSVANNLGYWEKAQDWAFMATKLLLTERIKAEDIDTTNLVSQNIMTAWEGPRIEASGSEMKIFGNVAMNIRFGVNSEGMAVLEYYDNEGRKLYDLGPGGITSIPVSQESWRLVYLKPLGLNISEVLGKFEYKSIGFDSSYAVYQYHSKVVAGVVEDPVNDKLYFKYRNKTEKVASGWYAYASSTPNSIAPNRQWGVTTENNKRIYPIGIHADNEPVYARSPVYMCPLVFFGTGGTITKYQNVYWNGRSDNMAEI